MRKGWIVLSLSGMMLFATGCVPDKVQEEIDKTEKENAEKQAGKEDKEVAPEDIEISTEQKEELENHEHVSEEEAVSELIEEQESIEIDLPTQKDKFTSHLELSQYMSNLFFLYHKGDLNTDDFYERIKPHLHEDFLELLPKSEADRKETFEVLQYTFLQYLPAPIESYELTEATTNIRGDEGESYRKYITDDSQFIFYTLRMKKEGDQWFVTDDSPAPPYEIDPSIEKSFKTPGGEE
ncbi:hypothetical protein [Planococcus alpniumensis]|uniref:hypothetical protein n=1 Tax=Planococcus alpniumensis TaxID=2708345 RepID=UPI001B8CA186|nr:hypothetical protein [Planococcus sp. MSAK28401]